MINANESMFVSCPVSCFIEWNLTKSDLGSDVFYEIELDDTSKLKTTNIWMHSMKKLPILAIDHTQF